MMTTKLAWDLQQFVGGRLEDYLIFHYGILAWTFGWDDNPAKREQDFVRKITLEVDTADARAAFAIRTLETLNQTIPLTRLTPNSWQVGWRSE